MKKIFLLAVAFFAMQFSFAQASAEAKTYVKNLGVKESLDMSKKDISDLILPENLTNFNSEFDAIAANFITSFENLFHENFTSEDLNKMNSSIENNTTLDPIMPKNLETFQEKAMKAEEEMGLSLEGIVMKYGDPVKLEQMQQE